VRSYSIYKHDTTLKMTFGAIFFLDDFNSGPPNMRLKITYIPDKIIKEYNSQELVTEDGYVYCATSKSM
jgi:hypothetical protein